MRIFAFLLMLLWPLPASAQGLSDLAWMKGCWRFERAGETVTESWTAPSSAPVMLGYGTSERGGQLVWWEQTRIVSDGEGVAFVAMPMGRAATRFAMIESGHQRVVFANPAHDFPQRIAYARDGNRLNATTSGENAADETYPFRRIRCPSELRP
ncbi:MAG: hypothetical protein JNJ73_04360 [Hyphomonadaceae bacterium]|nr:hypothetical protein [Hyphomonadaceae bacterium]